MAIDIFVYGISSSIYLPMIKMEEEGDKSDLRWKIRKIGETVMQLFFPFFLIYYIFPFYHTLLGSAIC